MKSTKTTAIVLLLTLLAVIPAFAFLATTPVVPERVGIVTVGEVTVMQAPVREAITLAPVYIFADKKVARKARASHRADTLGLPTVYGSKMLLANVH